MKEQARAKARHLAREFAQRGAAIGWFERQVHCEDSFDREEPQVRRFRVAYQRASMP